APPPPAAHSDVSAPAAASPEPALREAQPVEPRTRATNFDSLWPSARRRTEPPVESAHAEPATGSGHDASEAPPATRSPEPADRTDEQPRAVAVLKSGVVDGMGYTLYVDGSIEAELPQGTLRFASINELRAHLEKNA